MAIEDVADTGHKNFFEKKFAILRNGIYIYILTRYRCVLDKA